MKTDQNNNTYNNIIYLQKIALYRHLAAKKGTITKNYRKLRERKGFRKSKMPLD